MIATLVAVFILSGAAGVVGALWAATGGVVLPLFCGAAAAHLFGYGWGEGLFMGAVLTATSVSISAQTLMELRSLRSKEGSTILGAVYEAGLAYRSPGSPTTRGPSRCRSPRKLSRR